MYCKFIELEAQSIEVKMYCKFIELEAQSIRVK
jgi:hypothetical protein